MTTISLLTYEGTISPHVYQTCGMENLNRRQSPVISVQENEKDLEVAHKIDAHFEKYVHLEDPSFWKQRILVHILTSPYVVSATFIPSDLTKCQILFIQKVSETQTIRGFYAPYLSKKDREKLGAEKVFSNCIALANLEKSLEGLNQIVAAELCLLCNYFKNDSNTLFMGLTFKASSNSSDILMTRGWFKEPFSI